MTPSSRQRPGATSSRATRILGALTLAGLAVLAFLGLYVSPPDGLQGETVRLIYVHPASATMAYLGFGVCAVASIAFLWPRTRSYRWDRLAGASAEVGVAFCVVTIVSGSIWGRYSWGVWWTWDPRLTLTALLLAVFVGYLALRRTGGDPLGRAKRSAITALCCFVVVPVDHEATSWWVGLHQNDTLFRIGKSPLIHGWQLATMLLSFVVFTLLFAWMVLHRLAIESMESRLEDEGYVWAIAERRSESGPAPAGATASSASSGPLVAGPLPPVATSQRMVQEAPGSLLAPRPLPRERGEAGL